MTIAALLLSVPACAGDDLTAALRDVAEAKRTATELTVGYREERPRDRTVALTVGSDGAVTGTVRTLRPGCDQAWQSECWREVRLAGRLDMERHRTLAGLLADADLGAAPAPVPPAPGAAYLQLRVRLEPATEISVGLSLDQLDSFPALARVRTTLLGVVEDAGG